MGNIVSLKCMFTTVQCIGRTWLSASSWISDNWQRLNHMPDGFSVMTFGISRYPGNFPQVPLLQTSNCEFSFSFRNITILKVCIIFSSSDHIVTMHCIVGINDCKEQWSRFIFYNLSFPRLCKFFPRIAKVKQINNFLYLFHSMDSRNLNFIR